MRNKWILATFFLCLWAASWAQSSWDEARITLLTCSPGEALYSSFGHSAIRIQDPSRGIDQVYNYGTFDFNTPNFYRKFLRGKLLYRLAIQSYRSFLRDYQAEGRSVYEEEVLLDGPEKEALALFLAENHRPENREYLYDFFFDNCSSRIRDVFEQVLGDRLTYQFPGSDAEITYRDAIDPYISSRPWIDMGIDLLLGQPTDQVADERDQMFLPDHLSGQLAYARVDGGRNLLGPRVQLLELTTELPSSSPVLRWVVLWCLMAFYVILWGFFPQSKLIPIVDVAYWIFLGLLGCLVAFMALGTDHIATQHNWNLLWLHPLFLLAGIGMWIKRDAKWLRIFGWIQLLLVIGTMIAWNWLPQRLPPSSLPLFLLLGLHCIRLAGFQKPLKIKEKTNTP